MDSLGVLIGNGIVAHRSFLAVVVVCAETSIVARKIKQVGDITLSQVKLGKPNALDCGRIPS